MAMKIALGLVTGIVLLAGQNTGTPSSHGEDILSWVQWPAPMACPPQQQHAGARAGSHQPSCVIVVRASAHRAAGPARPLIRCLLNRNDGMLVRATVSTVINDKG